MTPRTGVKGSPSGSWVLSAETLLTRLHELSEDIMLSPPQAAIILQVDEDWLKKQRQKQSNPTTEEDEQPLPYCKMGEGRNAAVRYRLGDVRKHLASHRVINTHGGRVCSFSSFADFMSRARIEDTWLFAQPTESLRPMDVFEALRSGLDFEDASWLTLGEYMDAVRDAAVLTNATDIDAATADGTGKMRDTWM